MMDRVEEMVERLTSELFAAELRAKAYKNCLRYLQARVEALEAEARWRANGAFLDKPDTAGRE